MVSPGWGARTNQPGADTFQLSSRCRGQDQRLSQPLKRGTSICARVPVMPPASEKPSVIFREQETALLRHSLPGHPSPASQKQDPVLPEATHCQATKSLEREHGHQAPESLGCSESEAARSFTVRCSLSDFGTGRAGGLLLPGPSEPVGSCLSFLSRSPAPGGRVGEAVKSDGHWPVGEGPFPHALPPPVQAQHSPGMEDGCRLEAPGGGGDPSGPCPASAAQAFLGLELRPSIVWPSPLLSVRPLSISCKDPCPWMISSHNP